MRTPFHSDCPFCGRATTISDDRFHLSQAERDCGNAHGQQALVVAAITCPIPKCREYELVATLHDVRREVGRSSVLAWVRHDAKARFSLIPHGRAKPLPNYVPEAIRSDYTEACLIADLSPKGSATLSRRCLQGMIRDFYGITRARLVDEIDSLRDKVDEASWAAIDAVRKLGNIGAHMEKDVDTIVDVDEGEATLLTQLIETLTREWYVARHERQQRMAAVVRAADSKSDRTRPGGTSEP